MNSLQQPLASPLEVDRPPQDVDGLLRAFFRAQVPEPWPALTPQATLSLRGGRAAPRRPSLLRSRVALAASVLILLIGQLSVSSLFSGYAGFEANRDRGGLEATNRIDGIMPSAPKPTVRLKKTEAIRSPVRDRIVLPGRR